MSETYLMIHPFKGQVFPFSGRGFTHIQGHVPAAMRRVAGALFLDRTGLIRSVADISPQADGPIASLSRVLGMGGPASYRFDIVEMPLDAFRNLLFGCIEQARNAFDLTDETWWPMVAPLAEVHAEVNDAKTLADLHALMRFPPDEDCLDLL